ncbi:MAG: hypothetical protein NVV74_19980 [Magnetospirillum sp.]|nr:hypothetical protein [Magnetospirillum sp.]
MIAGSGADGAKQIIEALHAPLSSAVAGVEEDVAIAHIAALLVGEVSAVLAGAVDQGRGSDARTFEAMFDVNAAASHFQPALDQGIRRAAAEIGRDGYAPASALVLAAGRALDSIADILRR